ncbi:MAG TPA: bifunctional diaminohydroxyphosphoribosylaminopyrimidine deaminase/5-amino-6-(5-phosphoribosylamino)uracil reductase RibD [Casimicrobiaceae bacterium]|nr:bifunctional diaminohydroxyphosphoribosylaminopyrimidine deaminase/5-amino-6-(5-phosphoribosylamino)uracil reductase RibD [Casimicrobiaceae bacterium]
MARALELAARGLYTTTPNPRVGAVVVREGVVIGEGFHRRAGEAHAEVAALADARARGHDVRGATVYVNLEPCNHQGRTGPCSRALIDAGVGRVVFAMRDPFGPAQGGAAALASAGIAVTEGVRVSEARELNIGFVSNIERGVPWVRTKVAASLDGRTALASGESQWITGALARADGHAWRARACAILTGVGTIVQDDPALTVREVVTTRQPLRVVIDRHGDTPRDSRVLADDNALIVTAARRPGAAFGAVEVIELPDADGRVDLRALMRVLAQRGVNELHVEAGARLNGALVDAGLVDEFVVYLAPSIIGDPARGIAERSAALATLAARTPLTFHRVDTIGDDLRVIARVRRGADDASSTPRQAVAGEGMER